MVDVSSQPARHPIAALGVVLTSLSALAFLALWGLESLGWIHNPYLGLLIFIAVPGLFVIGLLLIPLGAWLVRRRQRRGLAPLAWPRLDLNDRRTFTVVLGVAVATMANVVLLMAAGYGAVHYMDSPAFCGAVCHVPMTPQYVQWQQAPHARVACASCHIGNAPGSFIKAKLNGTRQLAHLVMGSFPRPIPSPHNLPGTASTCEQCHSTAAFAGDRTKVIRSYSDDEANSESATTLSLHVGPGGTGVAGEAGNIHWHAQPGRVIEFVENGADAEAIDWVRVTEPGGQRRVYVNDGVSADALKGAPQTMDCVTCHNRPAHPFSVTADRTVDAAIAQGQLDRTLPYVRREAVRVLKTSHADAEEGAAAVARDLRAFYAANYPDLASSRRAAIDQAAQSVQSVYRRFVFPSMRVTWGTYPNQLGHTDSAGCFRCHDDSHKAPDGKVIRQDCTLCHTAAE
jgi:nitrate/TMAO reductase-like tetraheme cytochrome c subunit